MGFLVSLVSSYSILLPFFAAVWRFRRINQVFYPFLLIILLGLINETVSILIIYEGYSNVVPYNIYSLLEAVIALWQLEKWKLFPHRRWWMALSALFLAVWIVEVFWISGFYAFCSYFILLSSFVITILSILMINRTIVSGTGNLSRNPIFIISVGFVIYYAYSLIVESFVVNSTGNDLPLMSRIELIFGYTNIFTNLLYTLAIAWMPTRLRFILPY